MSEKIEIPDKLNQKQLDYYKSTLADNKNERIAKIFLSLIKWGALVTMVFVVTGFLSICFNTSSEGFKNTSGFITFLIEKGKEAGIITTANLSGWSVAGIFVISLFVSKRKNKTLVKKLAVSDDEKRELKKKLDEFTNGVNIKQ